MKVCSVEGCGGTFRVVKGLCNKHYARLRKYGDPLVYPPRKPPIEREPPKAKICGECKEEKPIAEFYPRKGRRNGYSSYCKPCNTIRMKRQRVNNIEWFRNYDRKRKFGITADQHQEMLIEQSHKCAICCEVCPTGKALAVDHSHKTNKVRGLLCINCNRLLGHAKDNPEILVGAIKYLEERDVTFI